MASRLTKDLPWGVVPPVFINYITMPSFALPMVSLHSGHSDADQNLKEADTTPNRRFGPPSLTCRHRSQACLELPLRSSGLFNPGFLTLFQASPMRLQWLQPNQWWALPQDSTDSLSVTIGENSQARGQICYQKSSIEPYLTRQRTSPF